MRKSEYTVMVHAGIDTLWRILQERAENPDLPGVTDVRVVDRFEGGFVREMTARGLKIRERIFLQREEEGYRMVFEFEEHPLMSGRAVYRLVPTSRDSPVAPVGLTLSVFWVPKDPGSEREIVAEMHETLQRTIDLIKDEAEGIDGPEPWEWRYGTRDISGHPTAEETKGR